MGLQRVLPHLGVKLRWGGRVKERHGSHALVAGHAGRLGHPRDAGDVAVAEGQEGLAVRRRHLVVVLDLVLEVLAVGLPERVGT